MISVCVEGIGLLAPGLPGWAASAGVLRGEAAFDPVDVALPAIAQLPPAERRRAGATARLATAVGLEALDQAGLAAADMATVFASSGGDPDTIDTILTVLASEQRELSPTRFHNSLHNAASGYWALACASAAPSTSLCGYDGSFAIGLLDAASQAVVSRRPVTLIAYDLPYPEPLHQARPISMRFGVALVLAADAGARTLARLSLELLGDAGAGTAMEDVGLEALRRSNPAARSLTLLAALAGQGGRVLIEGIAGNLLDVRVVAG